MLGGPWPTTLARWRQEGLPEKADFADFFGRDHQVGISGDISARFAAKKIEETDHYVFWFDPWGTTSKIWKHASSTPHRLGRTIVDRPSWKQAKSHMVVGRDRVNGDWLKAS